MAADPTLHQAGVIAYRILGGRVEVLLMTSRDSGRWIIPKGNIGAGMTAAQAAAQEAFEEAGVKGKIRSPIPLGFYNYFKVMASGEARAVAVEVYLLRVDKCLGKWPERHERRRSWFSPETAAGRIEEPGVVPLLRRLMEFEQDLARPVRRASVKPRPRSRAR